MDVDDKNRQTNKKKTGKESDAMPSENEQIHEWMRMGGERKIRVKINCWSGLGR